MSGIDDVQAVLSFYAPALDRVRQIEPLANAGGWSGSRLWRVSDAEGRLFCLRRWPAEHPSSERLRLIHAVLGLVSLELPIVAFPLRTAGEATFVEHQQHRWELTHWMPGHADYHARPDRARLKRAMQVLARFHLLASRYQRRFGIAPAIADRRRQWAATQDQGLQIIERSLAAPLDDDLDGRARRLLAAARGAFNRLDVRLLDATQELWLQPAIRDVHHDHLLFTGDEVTGLIDFGAMRIDTPLTDVARLVGSLVGDDHEARQFAFDVYSELRPLSESNRQLIDMLDASGLVLGALHWLTWLYVERRNMGPLAPIARRLDQLLARLQPMADGLSPI